MPTLISDLTPLVRQRIIEPTPSFWSDDELTQIAILGIKDLWRAITDLKQEHFCEIDTDHVTLESGDTKLSGVPQDVHKIYMIEPLDLSANGNNHGLRFQPLPYNDQKFQLARSESGMDPMNNTIYYALRGQGSPVNAVTVDVAPKISAQVRLAFTYVPTLKTLSADSQVPIPGEADNAIIAWTVAFARAKEREDRSPDPGWLTIYATEKQSLLQSLGLRQYQEPSYSLAMWEEYW